MHPLTPAAPRHLPFFLFLLSLQPTSNRICSCSNPVLPTQKRNQKGSAIYNSYAQTRKCLGINLTKEVKDLHIENYKTLVNEIEEGSNKCESIPRSWTGIISIMEMTTLPKVTYTFDVIAVKTPMALLTGIEINGPEIQIEPQMAPNNQRNFEDKEQFPEASHYQLQNALQSLQSSTHRGTGLNRYTDQWNRADWQAPDFPKGANRKRAISSINGGVFP
jgi:hypothetical protein